MVIYLACSDCINPACSDLIGSNGTERGPGSCASWTCLGEVRRRAGVI